MRRIRIHGISRLSVDLGKDKENLKPLAEDVAIHRGTLIAETLFHIAAIRSLHSKAASVRNAQVTCVRAHLQDNGACEGHQAAHLLPGQILVGARPVWDWAQLTKRADAAAFERDILRLGQQTQYCFAKTNVLPALYNRADTQAESGVPERGIPGLKELFGDVVQDLWSEARVDPARPLVIDRNAVLASLKGWFQDVNVAYEVAASRKLEAANRLQISKDFTERTKSDERRLEARILTVYASSFKIENAAQFVLAYLPQLHERYAFL
jgi:hypothetical protein